MTPQKPPKKSEVIEIRLPHRTKTDFMASCRAQGRTASAVIRGHIEAELSTAPAKRRSSRGTLAQALVAAALGLALGTVAAPTLADSRQPSRAEFERLDRNRDGVLSFAEFGGR